MNIKPYDNRPLLKPCTLEGRNYLVDPYIGCEHYCYYCYALNQAQTDWSKEILIHKELISQLESELAEIAASVALMEPLNALGAAANFIDFPLGLFSCDSVAWLGIRNCILITHSRI